jgi:hypothetical protein
MKIISVIGFRRTECEDTELIQLALVRVYEVGNEPMGSTKRNLFKTEFVQSWSNEKHSFVCGRSCLGKGPDILTEDSSGLPQSLTNIVLVPPIRPRPLPSTSCRFIFQYYDVSSEIPTAPLHKPRICDISDCHSGVGEGNDGI